mmetsp:Transcript_11535/g.48286  ORF Transcript_11535/g.48286 Transcript_11535/m.48286 type:complete len:434 (-) Transcript_11535:113-1414(-)
MTRRGVLDPTRTDRSVRSVAILDTNSGENVDALLLVYPNDDASVLARCRAMKGLILALRGATRSLSGRDATCATLGAGDEEDGAVRVGLADLTRGSGALLAVETTFAEDARAARLAATTAEHIRFLHGDSWVDRLREERDARRDGAADTNEAFDASDADGNQTPHSLLLGETIASFLLTRAAWEPARVVARVDPGIRAALFAAETATRPLAERLVGAAPFADLKPGAMFILADDDEGEEGKEGRPGSRGAACTVLASHLPHDVTARLAAYVSRAPIGSSGRHARWVWPTTTATTRADDDGRLERRGLVAARKASVAACLMLRSLWDEAVDVGDEAAIARLGDFEMRAAAAAAAAAARVTDGGGFEVGVIDGAGFEVGSEVGSWEDRRRARGGSNGSDVDGGVVDALGTLAEVFDAQRRDRELAGAAGDGPSFG